MGKRYIVLCVCCAEHTIEYLSKTLKDSYRVISTDNGADALEIMRSKNRPDVVLLDLASKSGSDIPGAMSADEELRSIPVIAVADDAPDTRSCKPPIVELVPRSDSLNALCARIKCVLKSCEINEMCLESDRIHRETVLEQQLSTLVDGLPVGIATIKVEGQRARCTYFNSSLPALFRMSGDDFPTQFSEPVPPEWLRIFIANAQTFTGFEFEFSVGGKNDSESCRIKVTATCKENELHCVFLDVTAKQGEPHAEEKDGKLPENHMRLETVINNAPGGISYSERGDDGRFHTMFMNQGLIEMLGYSTLEECLADVSTRPNNGLSERDIAAIRKKIRETPDESGFFKYAFKYTKHTDDSELWLSMRCRLIRGDDGRVKIYSFITNITKEKRIETELRAVAFFDPLTGLFNRHAFMQNARSVIDKNPAVEFALMSLNVGSFRVMNDLLGRDVGDKVLITIGNAIRELFDDNGVYGRVFADKFIVLTPYSERGVHPQTFLDAVRSAVAESGLVSHEVQYYIGVYKIIDRNMSVANMADRASMACRSINGSFQEHIAYYDEQMRQNMLDEQELCDDSRRALENNEFCLYFQPVYGIKANRFVSAEALVRWIHPLKGMVSPGKFIPLFEKNGFIAELDLYILEQVCEYMKRREDEGLPKFPISVNISRMSLYDPELFDTISRLTDRYKVDPRYFRIEITESAYNDNPAQLLETIGKLRDKCYPVLMDDFGSGYSSLNTLKDIPIDILKLDMKFMQGFEKNDKVGTIVTSVARMAKWLNIPMLAEGVETKEQFEFLASIGCAYIQGYYFSRPVPEEEFTRLTVLEDITGNIAAIEKHALNEEVNELLGSNALVSKLISGAFGGFGIYEMYDDKLEAIRVNDGYMQIMGYTPEDFNDEHVNVWDMMPPEYAEVSRKACYEALKTDKAVRTHILRYDKNGSLLHLDGVHRRLGGTDDNPIICIAFNDITEQLESEQLVDRSRTEIEEILKATGSAVTDTDYENSTSFYAGDMSDYEINLANLSGQINSVAPSAFHPDDYLRAKEFCGEKCAGKHSEEFRIRNRYNGKYYWWKLTEVRTLNDSGELARTICIANNIDSEKRAKLALEQERAHVDAVMNKLGAGILMVEVSDNHKAHIIYSNESFWEITGYEKTDDGNFFEKIQTGLADSNGRGIYENVINSGSLNSEYTIVRDNGEEAVLELTVGLSHMEDGKRVYMIIVSDITEQHNDRLKLEAIVRNFHEGLALISIKDDGKPDITYANDKFYNVLDADKNHTERVVSMLEKAVRSGVQTSDVHISRGKSTRTVRLRVGSIGVTSGHDNYVISVSDVTLARAEAQNRIAERTANAALGLYDEVFELNYRAKTSKLTYFRRDPERAENAKESSLDAMITGWGKRYVSPDDYDMFRDFISAPFNDPDFTDAYCEACILDDKGDGEYHSMGMTLVRSHSDVCMMFIRDKERRDDSVTQARIDEAFRRSAILAEQTGTTVIEIDHVENKVITSPSISEYWISKLSPEELAEYDNVKNGLAVYPDDKEKFARFFESLYSENEPQGSPSINIRLKMEDGAYRWCRVSVTLTRSKDGRVLSSLCTINLLHNNAAACPNENTADEP